MGVLGVHTFTFASEWRPETARKVLPHLKEQGVRLIELPLLRPDELDVEGTRATAEAFDIEISCSLGLPGRFDIVDRPDEAVAFLTGALDVVERVGAPYLSGVPYGTLGRVSGKPPIEAEKDAVVRLIERAAKAARMRGLRLGIEPCNRYETHLMNTAADAVAAIERSGADNVFVHLDTYHMNIEERGMAAGFADAGRLLGYVHVSESNRGVPGAGTVDWPEVMRGLAAIDYAGPVVVESMNHVHPDIAAGLAIWKPVAEDPDDVVDKGLPFLRETARAAGYPL